GIFLPAEPILDDVAGLEPRVVGLDHLADRATGHDLADPDGGRVGCKISHPPAHVGIKRQIDDAHQHLIGAGLRHGNFLDAEIRLRRLARWPARKYDAAAGLRGHRDVSGWLGANVWPKYWHRRAGGSRAALGGSEGRRPLGGR